MKPIDNSDWYLILALNSSCDEEVFKHSGIEPLKEFLGSYKGITERSYLVEHSREAFDLAKMYNQESVLILFPWFNNTRSVRLVSVDNLQTILEGVFKNVGQVKPDSEGWTQDLSTGDYFIIEEN